MFCLSGFIHSGLVSLVTARKKRKYIYLINLLIIFIIDDNKLRKAICLGRSNYIISHDFFTIHEVNQFSFTFDEDNLKKVLFKPTNYRFYCS